jgi:hypothetical protein
LEYVEGRLPKEREIDGFENGFLAGIKEGKNAILSDFKNLLQEVKEGLTK